MAPAQHVCPCPHSCPTLGPNQEGTKPKVQVQALPRTTPKSSPAHRPQARSAGPGGWSQHRLQPPGGTESRSPAYEWVLRPLGWGLGPRGCRSQAGGPDGGRWAETGQAQEPASARGPWRPPGWARLLTGPGEVQSRLSSTRSERASAQGTLSCLQSAPSPLRVTACGWSHRPCVSRRAVTAGDPLDASKGAASGPSPSDQPGDRHRNPRANLPRPLASDL